MRLGARDSKKAHLSRWPWGPRYSAMLKSELVQVVSARNPHLQQRDVENVLEAILDTVANALSRGYRVEIRGFGVFGVKRRSARMSRNPRTGIPVAVLAKNRPSFKAGMELRERLNPGPSPAPSHPGGAMTPQSVAQLILREFAARHYTADEILIARQLSTFLSTQGIDERSFEDGLRWAVVEKLVTLERGGSVIRLTDDGYAAISTAKLT